MRVHPSTDGHKPVPPLPLAPEAAAALPVRENERPVHYAKMAQHVREGVDALQRRDLQRAIDAFEQAYEVAAGANLGSDALVGTLRNLALARREAGDHAGAVHAYGLALQTPGATAAQRAAILHGMGMLDYRVGAYDQARARLAESYALWQDTPNPREQARVALDLSRTLRALGRHAEAAPIVEASLGDLAHVDPSLTADAYLELGRIRLALGDLEECGDLLRRTLEHLSDPDPERTAEVQLVKAQLLMQSGQPQAALSACAQAMDLGVRYRLWDDLRDAHRFASGFSQERQSLPGSPRPPDGGRQREG